MSHTIAILNGKGGVGKTLTAINLGTALWIMGKKVLMVDADPQCNLTCAMDKTAYPLTENTLYEWTLDEDYDNPEHIMPTYMKYDGLDYIPASPQMESLNQWLVNKTKREDYLLDRLSLVSSLYDYVIIDCAPAIDSLINTNVLVAADSIIIPNRCDMFGMQSQGLMDVKINDIRKKFKKPLPILGYLLTQYENTRESKLITDYFKSVPEINLFRRPIRKCAKCTECISRQMSVYELDAFCTAADDYMMMAEEVAGVKVRPKKSTPAAWKEKATKAFEKFIQEQEQ